MRSKSKTKMQMHIEKTQEKKYFGKQKIQDAGLTLVALVVTIIVLLILAGISITTLVGQNGLVERSKNAVAVHSKGSVIENAKQDILELQIQKASENLKMEVTQSDLKTILRKYFIDDILKEGNKEKLEANTELTANNDNGGENVKIKLSDIYDGTLVADKEVVDTEKSILDGQDIYYAKINEKECLIFADLITAKSSKWTDDDGIYSWTAQTGLKTYAVADEAYVGKFGTGKLIEETSSGNQRFYVMATEDVDPDGTNYYYWYYAAFGKLDNYNSSSVNDFGQGGSKTAQMIETWNLGTSTSGYGEQNKGLTSASDENKKRDMWGAIQDSKVKSSWGTLYSESNTNGWFIPSRAEWAAFGDYVTTKIGVSTDSNDSKYYANYGLNSLYWSSTQSGTYFAYRATFSGLLMGCSNVNLSRAVRFCATF